MNFAVAAELNPAANCLASASSLDQTGAEMERERARVKQTKNQTATPKKAEWQRERAPIKAA